MPSNQMLALLGLLAVAGYQNRDKLSELFGRATGAPDGGAGQAAQSESSGIGGILGNLGGFFGGASTGAGVARGLGELLDQFTRRGQGATAKSWVETGPNQPVTAAQLEVALGEDTIASLIAQTGLTREDLLLRLQAVLPSAVDGFTPQGRLPTIAEASQLM